MLFPGALPAAGTASASDTLAAAGHTSLHNTGADETRAIATKIGTGSSTPTSGMLLRGNGAGTSAWAQAALTTDVSGVLPVANGGSGTTTLIFPAGADTLVARASTDTLTNKTLTTPTIASFANANHDHTNSAGGGTLGTNALSNTSVTANKLSTGAAYSNADASETTTSTSYVQLTTKTDAVTVTIGVNGLALVLYGCDIANSVAAGRSFCAVAMSGANTSIAGTDGNKAVQFAAVDNGFGHQEGGYVVGGLTAGSTTFTLFYKVSANTGTFAFRHISVVPL